MHTLIGLSSVTYQIDDRCFRDEITDIFDLYFPEICCVRNVFREAESLLNGIW